MIDRPSFWTGTVDRVKVAERPKTKFFPGTKIPLDILERKLKQGENFSKRIKPELRIVIQPCSYTFSGGSFKGHAIVVKGPDAHYVCHSVRHAVRETNEILRSYDCLIREKN